MFDKSYFFAFVAMILTVDESAFAQSNVGGWGGFGKGLEKTIDEATKTLECKTASPESMQQFLDTLWAEDLMRLYADACKTGERGEGEYINWQYGKFGGQEEWRGRNVERAVPRCWIRENDSEIPARLETIFETNRDKRHYARLSWYIKFIKEHLDASDECKQKLLSLLERSVGPHAWRQANRPWPEEARQRAIAGFEQAEQQAYDTWGCADTVNSILYETFGDKYLETTGRLVRRELDSGINSEDLSAVDSFNDPSPQEAVEAGRRAAVQTWNSLDREHRRALRRADTNTVVMEQLTLTRANRRGNRECATPIPFIENLR